MQVSLEMLEQLPPYEDLRGLEEKLRFENKLSFDSIFNEPTGYYMVRREERRAHADLAGSAVLVWVQSASIHVAACSHSVLISVLVAPPLPLR